MAAAGGGPEPDDRPAWPTTTMPALEFYSTVWLFPWRGGVFVRWLLVAAGLCPAFALYGVASERGWSWMGLFAFTIVGMPLAILLVWTASYASALFLYVLEATAAGADTFQAWPEPDWTDWLGQFMSLAYAVALAIGLAVAFAWSGTELVARWGGDPALGWPVSESTFRGALSAACCVLTIPVVLLSTQQATSRLVPVTWPVLRSLFSRRVILRGWLPLLLASLPLVLLPFAQVAFAPRRYFALAAIGLGPQVAAALLIYARLAGRLGWEIGEEAGAAAAEAPLETEGHEAAPD